MPSRRSTARATITPVKAEITNMFFDTREYNTVTLPAGYYDALRITIGKAEAITGGASCSRPCACRRRRRAGLSDVLSDSQMEVVENGNKYQVKFSRWKCSRKLKIGSRTDSFSAEKYGIIASAAGGFAAGV